MSQVRKKMYSSMSNGGNPAIVFRSLTVDPGDLLQAQDSLHSQRSVKQGRRISHFHVKKGIESLNYKPPVNQLQLEYDKTCSYRTIETQSCMRMGIFLLAGALTGLVGVVLECSIEKLGHLKSEEFEHLAMKKYKGSFKEFMMWVGFRFVGVLVPVMISAGLVVFIAPFAAGGGVAQCIAFLNGVRVPKLLSIKGLVVKIISTILTCISGLAAGKEGPMMHIGAAIGGSLPSALPCLVFKMDNERRDFAAAGLGAGLAVVFGAPIGGLLIALEEGCSYLNIDLMWKIYLCCVFGYALGAIVISLIEDGEVKLYNARLLTLGYITNDVTEYNLFELIPFAVMAVIGGLIAALLIRIHEFFAVFRDRHINKSKIRKLVLVFLAACLVVFFQMSSIWVVRSCSPLPKDAPNTTSHQLYCSNGERSDMSVMFSKTQGDILRLFFSPHTIRMRSLAVYAVIYFILMSITMILAVSGGIFIPQIILGAAWGRLFGMLLNKATNDADWAKPAKYAYLGAAAQLSGTVGKTFSILVIFVEASSSITLAFPLMVVVSIARSVCTLFVLPIYETQIHIMGLPFLSYNPPPLECDIPTSNVLPRMELVTLPPSPTVGTVMNTLKGNKHSGYPIVEVKNSRLELIGLILRQQLLILLKYRAYLDPPPSTSRQMCECYVTYTKEARKRLNEKQIFDGVKEEDYGLTLDLSPYYDLFPPTVTQEMPMIKTYEYFRSLGIRHLVVVTKKYEPIGMITRKDLAKYHTIEHLCKVKVKEMVVRD